MTDDQIRAHVCSLDLLPTQRRDLLGLIETCGQRQVGKNALHNVITHFASQKNDATRSFESHTVERLCALELELDPDVVAYYCQPTCTGVRRNGGKNVSSGTLDFLVLRTKETVLLECKDRAGAAKRSREKPEEWVADGEGYRWIPYEEWARERGLSFQVWLQPPRWSIYLSNLELMVELRRSAAVANKTEEQIAAAISKRPHTIDELMCAFPRFNAGTAAQLLASRRLFGPVHEISITDTAHFTLYPSRDQAQEAESLIASRAHDSLEQPTSLLLQASATDLREATRRLNKIDESRANGASLPRSLQRYAPRVDLARRDGLNPLAVCLSNYANCGNRLPRLSQGQLNAIDEIRRSHWLTGKAHDLRSLHALLNDRCAEDGEPTPSYKTLCKYCKEHSDRRALGTGGKRAYQANRSASDPRQRTLRTQARHCRIQIDSTKLDTRVLTSGGRADLLDCPIVYLAVDSCTREVMAHAYVFGAARRDGLALLIRDYVRRHKCLPHHIQVDRGTENTSDWLRSFCALFRINLVVIPTASSRSNSSVENLNGRVNLQMGHRLKGSTAPDKAGRSVDGKFKSYRTAELQFTEVAALLEEVLYEVFPTTPDQDGISPADYRENAAGLVPQMGLPVQFDEHFLYETSIPIKARTIDPRKGIRFQGKAFTSNELMASTAEVVEVRRDPGDCTLLYVRTTRRVLKAWASSTIGLAGKPELERLFESLMSAQTRRDSKATKDARSQELSRKTAEANNRKAGPSPCKSSDAECTDTPSDVGGSARSDSHKEQSQFEDSSDPPMDFDELPVLEELP